MKRSLPAVAVVVLLGHAAAAARPPEIAPVRYAVTLSPDRERHTFTGQETIDVRLDDATRAVTLNAVGLQIVDARVQVGDETLPATVSYDAANETITLVPSRALPAGDARLVLAWRGRLADDLYGLFETETAGHRCVFTHFEPSGARRAFPCFDEPRHKARFQLTAEIDRDDDTLSNSAIEERTPLDDGRQRVRFAETAPLPTYLVVLAIGRFAELHTTVDGTPLRVVAPAGQLPLARFALATATALLPRFAEYFDRPYAFDKLDLVAVPEFAPGGMENAGAIFLRDDRMLVDVAHASPATVHAAAMLIAHELAHQWLGDLVTPRTWNDLWVSEATATYVAHEIVAAWRPEWRPWEELQPSIDQVMADDELAATHAVRLPVESAAPRAVFDAIVYTKGAALLRMAAGWLGSDTIRDALRALVREHAYGSVGATELWTALDAVAPTPVASSLRPWFERRGHPALTVHGTCHDATLTLSVQQQPAAHAQSATWPIPLTLRWPGGQRVEMISATETTIAVEGVEGCPAWIDANAGRLGFYRVRYAPVLANALGDAAETALDPAERIGLASDAWLDVREGGSLGAYLALLTKLRGDRSPGVLDEIGRRLAFIGAELVRSTERSTFERLVEELLAPAHAALGWAAREDDDDATRLARSRVIEILATVAHAPDVVRQAAQELRRYLADSHSVDGALADAVVAIGAQTGNSDRYDDYLTRVRAASTPEEQERFRDALAHFERPELLRRTLALLFTGTVPAQELTRFSADIADNAHWWPSAWRFLKLHFDALARKAPRTGWLLPATQRFCDAAAAREIGQFFSTRELYPSVIHPVEQAEQRIATCAALRQRASVELAAWLHARYAEARSSRSMHNGGRR